MYLLDASDDASAGCGRAGRLGDSLVVGGGGGLWNVHVHVDDAGRRDRGRARGRPPAPDPRHLSRGAGRRAPQPPAGAASWR